MKYTKTFKGYTKVIYCNKCGRELQGADTYTGTRVCYLCIRKQASAEDGEQATLEEV